MLKSNSVHKELACDRKHKSRFNFYSNFYSNRVQNDSGAHPASYSVGTRGSSPGGKAAGAWSWPLTSI
jgi:hypothetical protein